MPNQFDDLVQALNQIAGLAPNTKATLTTLIEQIKSLSDVGSPSVDGLINRFKELVKTLVTSGESSTLFNTAIRTLRESITEANDSFGNLLNIVSKVSTQFQETIKSAGGVAEALKTNRDGIGDVASELINLAGVMMGHPWFTSSVALRAASVEIDTLSRSYSDLTGVLQKFGIVGDAATAAMRVFAQADVARGFENEIMKVSAASGTFTEIIGGLVDSTAIGNRLSDAMRDISMRVKGDANVMGMLMGEAMSRQFDIMRTLPEELNKTYSGLSQSGGPVSSLQLMSTVAKGTGLSFAEVKGIADDMFKAWGDNAEEAARRTVMLTKVAGDLHIPFQGLKGVIDQIDQSFRMWGSTAQDTLGIFTQINSVLKDQGIGWEGQSQIVKTLVESIRNLDISKLGFIATVGGGSQANPVQAGLQTELLLQQGQVGDVIQMMQRTIEMQTGGGIVTLKEAAETPGMEEQFMTQRMMLGNIFGIQDTGTANRLMEVMSQLQVGGELSVDVQKELKDVFKRGESIQDRQYTKLTEIHNELVAMNQLSAAVSAYRIDRGTMGAGAIGEGINQRRINEQANTSIVIGEPQVAGEHRPQQGSTLASAHLSDLVSRAEDSYRGIMQGTQIIMSQLGRAVDVAGYSTTPNVAVNNEEGRNRARELFGAIGLREEERRPAGAENVEPNTPEIAAVAPGVVSNRAMRTATPQTAQTANPVVQAVENAPRAREGTAEIPPTTAHINLVLHPVSESGESVGQENILRLILRIGANNADIESISDNRVTVPARSGS